MNTNSNPLAMRGIDFVVYAANDPSMFLPLWTGFGLSCSKMSRSGDVDVWRSRDVTFLVDRQDGGFAADFVAEHGPCIPAMGWRVDDANFAFDEAVRRGAQPYDGSRGKTTIDAPAIVGIGGSLIYFVDDWDDSSGWRGQLQAHSSPTLAEDRGFYAVDHLTNNVPKGTMATWRAFYRDVFGFTDVRTFDIRGDKTGLQSYALRSPDGSFCIPINEGSEAKSQIEEYLREYRGAGVQHIALICEDLLGSLDAMEGCGIETLDIEAAYYDTVFERVPGVVEDPARIAQHQVLVDGDDAGYLLQIFTRNVIGPIFFELIQRRNHLSFGEGNFGALFRSIERDQERRGVL